MATKTILKRLILDALEGRMLETKVGHSYESMTADRLAESILLCIEPAIIEQPAQGVVAPVAWLKTGGKIYKDQVYMVQAHAEKVAAADPPATCIPLFASAINHSSDVGK